VGRRSKPGTCCCFCYSRQISRWDDDSGGGSIPTAGSRPIAPGVVISDGDGDGVDLKADAKAGAAGANANAAIDVVVDMAVEEFASRLSSLSTLLTLTPNQQATATRFRVPDTDTSYPF